MKKMMVVLLAGAMLMMATSAMATSFSGAIWTYDTPFSQEGAGNLLLPSGMPTITASATFTVNDLNFDSGRGTLTYDTFLKGDSNSNINGLAWTSGTPAFINSFVTGGNFTGSIFQFTGTAHFDENATIRHDDGFFLTLMNLSGGFVKNVDSSYPTGAINTSLDLNNAAGDYQFILNYGANNGFPEVLIASGVAPVPEPATMLLLGLGLIGVAGIRRFKK
jgi:hypothetical protein